MANAPLTKLLQKILTVFKIFSATLDTVTMDGNGIHNTVSIDRVMLPPYSTQEMTEPTETAARKTQ